MNFLFGIRIRGIIILPISLRGILSIISERRQYRALPTEEQIFSPLSSLEGNHQVVLFFGRPPARTSEWIEMKENSFPFFFFFFCVYVLHGREEDLCMK